jgi:hypothetical protein
MSWSWPESFKAITPIRLRPATGNAGSSKVPWPTSGHRLDDEANATPEMFAFADPDPFDRDRTLLDVESACRRPLDPEPIPLTLGDSGARGIRTREIAAHRGCPVQRAAAVPPPPSLTSNSLRDRAGPVVANDD